MVGFILVVNVGSSSLKYSLFDVDSSEFYAVAEHDISTNAPTEHIHRLKELIDSQASAEKPLLAVGYRIVHGGKRQLKHCLIDDTVVADLEAAVPLDPEHLPAQIRLVKLLRRQFHDASHIACFDTAFHSTMPRAASTLALPKRLRNKGLRRYGFHGLSYEYVTNAIRNNFPNTPHSKVVVAHLGSGASVAAIRDGVSIDTTMGLTPASGLPMSTRIGDIDPNLVSFLQSHERLSTKETARLLNFQSGLLGLGGSKDMKTLIERMDTDEDASTAVEVFVYQLVKSIGAYTAVLGGLDALVFTGGIGEQAPRIRTMVAEALSYTGIVIDTNENLANKQIISTPGSSVAVYVATTNEGTQIAKHCIRILHTNKHGDLHE